MRALPLLALLILSALSVSAQENSNNTTIVRIMYAFLIAISAVFVLAILSILRKRSLLELVRSAHFFKIRNVITAWTFMGSAVLLYAITEMLFAFTILTDLNTYLFLKTLFGAFLAAGLLLQYMVLQKYIKQHKRKVDKKTKKAGK